MVMAYIMVVVMSLVVVEYDVGDVDVLGVANNGGIVDVAVGVSVSISAVVNGNVGGVAVLLALVVLVIVVLVRCCHWC